MTCDIRRYSYCPSPAKTPADLEAFIAEQTQSLPPLPPSDLPSFAHVLLPPPLSHWHKPFCRILFPFEPWLPPHCFSSRDFPHCRQARINAIALPSSAIHTVFSSRPDSHLARCVPLHVRCGPIPLVLSHAPPPPPPFLPSQLLLTCTICRCRTLPPRCLRVKLNAFQQPWRLPPTPPLNPRVSRSRNKLSLNFNSISACVHVGNRCPAALARRLISKT